MRFNSLYPDIILEIVKIRDFTYNNKEVKIKHIEYYHQMTIVGFMTQKEYRDTISNGTINTLINQKYINICSQRLIKYLHNRFSMNYGNITTDNNIIISSYKKDSYGGIYIEYNLLSKYWNIFNILFSIKQSLYIQNDNTSGYNHFDAIIHNVIFHIKSKRIVSYYKKSNILLNEKINIRNKKNYLSMDPYIDKPEFTVSRIYFI